MNLYVKLKINVDSSKELKTYVAEYGNIFARILTRAIKSRKLDQLITYEKHREVIKNEIISDSMTDMEFNMLYERISKLRNANDKADIIIQSISSAEDFLDILNAQCFFDNDYYVLYKKIAAESMETIAFLVKTVLNSASFHDFDIRDIDSFANNPDNTDEEWQEYLAKFISKLTKDDKKILVDIIQNS